MSVVAINPAQQPPRYALHKRVWVNTGECLQLGQHVLLLLLAPISEDHGYQLDVTVSAPGRPQRIVYHFEDIADWLIDLTGWCRLLARIAAIEYAGARPVRALFEFHDARRLLAAV